MREFERLTEAAKRGDLQAVRAILHDHGELINRRDPSGATALHYAAFGGHRAVVEELVKQGAEINATDSRFGATPAGWAIEYLREMGGFLAIELEDLAHAIRRGEVEWVARFLTRFPALRQANDTHGKPFRQLARECGNQEIADLFGEVPPLERGLRDFMRMRRGQHPSGVRALALPPTVGVPVAAVKDFRS